MQMNRNNVNGVGGFDETNRSSSYLDYPASQPFINDDYRLPETRRFKAFPESNRQGEQWALSWGVGQGGDLCLMVAATIEALSNLPVIVIFYFAVIF